MTATTNATEQVTFEQADAELRSIVARLDETGVPVHEISELTARGKALVAVMRSYLTEQQARIDQIEAGENLPPFEIVAPGSVPAAAAATPAAAAAAPDVPAVDIDDSADEEDAVAPAETLSELPRHEPDDDADADAERRLAAARESGSRPEDDDIPF